MESEPPKADPPQRKRRWFQFSLRTLMIGVTLLAVICGYVAKQVQIVRERKTAFERILSDAKQFGIIYDTWTMPSETKYGSQHYCGLLSPDVGHCVSQYLSDDRPSAFWRWLGEPDIAVKAICVKPDHDSADIARLGELFPEATIYAINESPYGLTSTQLR